MADIFREQLQAKDHSNYDKLSERLHVASSNPGSDVGARLSTNETGTTTDTTPPSTLPKLTIDSNLKSENPPFQFPYGNFLMGAASGAFAYTLFEIGDECIEVPEFKQAAMKGFALAGGVAIASMGLEMAMKPLLGEKSSLLHPNLFDGALLPLAASIPGDARTKAIAMGIAYGLGRYANYGMQEHWLGYGEPPRAKLKTSNDHSQQSDPVNYVLPAATFVR
jgi:hypothetical protein